MACDGVEDARLYGVAFVTTTSLHCPCQRASLARGSETLEELSGAELASAVKAMNGIADQGKILLRF